MSFLTGNALGSCGCGGCGGAGVSGIQVALSSVPWTGWFPMDTVSAGLVTDWSTQWPDFYTTSYTPKKYLKRTIYIELGDSYNGNFWLKRVTTIAKTSNTFIDEYTTDYAGDPGSHPAAVNATGYGFTGIMPWFAQTVLDWAGYMPPSGYENSDAVTVIQSTETYFEATAVIPAVPGGIYLRKITVQLEDTNWWWEAQNLSLLGLTEFNLLDPATIYPWDYLNTTTGQWDSQGSFRFGYGYQIGLAPTLYTRVCAFLTPQWDSGSTPSTAPPIGADWLLCPIYEGADFAGNNLIAARGSFYVQAFSGTAISSGGYLAPSGYFIGPVDIYDSSLHLGYITSAMAAVKTAGQLGERRLMVFDKPNLQYDGQLDGIDARGPGEFIFNPGDCADFDELYITNASAGTYPPPTPSSSSGLSSSSGYNSQ